MPDERPTVTEEQLALFKEHVELQRDELAEQRERNRADEAIELRRISAEVEMHKNNLAHAGKVLNAQVDDRQQIRTFWSSQLLRFCWFVGVFVLVLFTICTVAILRGEAEVVFDALKTLGTHFMALLAGVGADRVWIHRKKAGISPAGDEKP